MPFLKKYFHFENLALHLICFIIYIFRVFRQQLEVADNEEPLYIKKKPQLHKSCSALLGSPGKERLQFAIVAFQDC